MISGESGNNGDSFKFGDSGNSKESIDSDDSAQYNGSGASGDSIISYESSWSAESGESCDSGGNRNSIEIVTLHSISGNSISGKFSNSGDSKNLWTIINS